MQIIGQRYDDHIGFRVVDGSRHISGYFRYVPFLRELLTALGDARIDDVDLIAAARPLQRLRVRHRDLPRPKHRNFVHVSHPMSIGQKIAVIFLHNWY